MLNIFADSLLLATRMRPLSTAWGDERDELRPDDRAEGRRHRAWLSLAGLQF